VRVGVIARQNGRRRQRKPNGQQGLSQRPGDGQDRPVPLAAHGFRPFADVRPGL